MPPKSKRTKKTSPPKPPLSEAHRQALESGEYDLNVQISLEADYNNHYDRCFIHEIKGLIRLHFTGFDELINVGHIQSWRILLSDNADDG